MDFGHGIEACFALATGCLGIALPLSMALFPLLGGIIYFKLKNWHLLIAFNSISFSLFRCSINCRDRESTAKYCNLKDGTLKAKSFHFIRIHIHTRQTLFISYSVQLYSHSVSYIRLAQHSRQCKFKVNDDKKRTIRQPKNTQQPKRAKNKNHNPLSLQFLTHT